MEYVIIGLLVVLIVLVIVSLIISKKDKTNEVNLVGELANFKNDLTKNMGDFKYDLARELIKDFSELNEKVEK